MWIFICTNSHKQNCVGISQPTDLFDEIWIQIKIILKHIYADGLCWSRTFRKLSFKKEKNSSNFAFNINFPANERRDNKFNALEHYMLMALKESSFSLHKDEKDREQERD